MAKKKRSKSPKRSSTISSSSTSPPTTPPTITDSFKDEYNDNHNNDDNDDKEARKKERHARRKEKKEKQKVSSPSSPPNLRLGVGTREALRRYKLQSESSSRLIADLTTQGEISNETFKSLVKASESQKLVTSSTTSSSASAASAAISAATTSTLQEKREIMSVLSDYKNKDLELAQTTSMLKTNLDMEKVSSQPSEYTRGHHRRRRQQEQTIVLGCVIVTALTAMVVGILIWSLGITQHDQKQSPQSPSPQEGSTTGGDNPMDVDIDNVCNLTLVYQDCQGDPTTSNVPACVWTHVQEMTNTLNQVFGKETVAIDHREEEESAIFHTCSSSNLALWTLAAVSAKEEEGNTPILTAQAFVLWTLYFATRLGDSSTNKKEGAWTLLQDSTTTRNVCEWNGMECNDHSQVTSISLHARFLSGSIPSELGLLTFLETLLLDTNKLTGTIPLELGNLTQLQTLHLERNRLTGSVPLLLFSSSTLVDLSVEKNRLEGTIPTEAGLATSLEILRLGRNAFNGSIPTELGLLSTHLRYLEIHRNAFTGTLPSEIGQLSQLEFLLLESNDLNGLIPTQVCNLWNLHLQSLGMKITSEKNQEQCSDDFYGGLQCPNQECCKDCPNQVAQ